MDKNSNSNTNTTPFQEHLCDLTLVIGDNEDTPQQRIPAIRKVLQMHSPVFDRMLDTNSPYKESNINEIMLHDDDPDIILVVLHIMALGITACDACPFEDPHDLLLLATLADKYDCVKVVKPCFSKWLADAEVKGEMTGWTVEERCGIFWTMGMLEQFETAWKELVDHSDLHTIFADYSWVVVLLEDDEWDERLVDKDALPDCLVREARKAASARLTALHRAVQHFVATHVKYLEVDDSGCIVANEICNKAIRGSLIQTMVKHMIPLHLDIQTIDKAAAVEWTAEPFACVAHALRNEHELTVALPGHRECLPVADWQREIDHVINEKVKLSPEIARHFEKFRKPECQGADNNVEAADDDSEGSDDDSEGSDDASAKVYHRPNPSS